MELAGSYTDPPLAITPSPGSVLGYPKARQRLSPPPPMAAFWGSGEFLGPVATPALPLKATCVQSELGNGIRSTSPSDKRKGKEPPKLLENEYLKEKETH